MATSHNLAPHGDGAVVPEGLRPEGGYELYRYKNAREDEDKELARLLLGCLGRLVAPGFHHSGSFAR
jgi:hypothetical protein